jgi:hypothetical protein
VKTLACRESKSIAMESADRRDPGDYFREDIGNPAALLNRDLSAWLR